MTDDEITPLLELYMKQQKAFKGFLSNVTDFFTDNDRLIGADGRGVVHSTKWRLKNPEHLKEKLKRKSSAQDPINESNLFKRVTDFAGVRVMHLKRHDFAHIHTAIMDHIEQQHWFFVESPKAYTWDPEYSAYFASLGIKNEIKESFYTSVHYLVRPNETSPITCEIQCRSLFEEIWGEVDHDLNYPNPTQNKACSEQLKVLAKLVGAGTRLVDSIYNSIEPTTESA